ncbi:MAG: hypothetical protein M0Z88_04050 [Actinomycetota bacterium]|nr:hypothetical protein [Actinomycetota bacterium]
MTQTQNPPVPGASFDLPGVPGQTQWFDEYEDTEDLPVTLPASTATPLLGIADFRRTDIVFNWRHKLNITTQDYVAGTETLNASAYAPYNVLGPVKLKIQNQYSAVDVENGIDIAIFNAIRPRLRSDRRGNNGANPAGDPVGATGQGYLNASTPQANLVAPAHWTDASTAYEWMFDIPGGKWFDEYYALDIAGNMLGGGGPVFVSPQYLAGTQRLIKTSIKLNPGLAATTDEGPVVANGTITTPATFAGSGTLSIRRQGVYGSNSVATLPPQQPWQYSLQTNRLPIAGVSQKVLQVPDETGQLLCLYGRMFDPLAASGIGAPIQLSEVTKIEMTYGSGLSWFDGTPDEMQLKWLEQHGFLLPQGVFAFDFAIDENDRFSNKRALNTLTTAGIQCKLYFSSPTSADAYCVLGTESLVYVT